MIHRDNRIPIIPLRFAVCAAVLIALGGCGRGPGSKTKTAEIPIRNTNTLFTLMQAGETGITFTNRVEDSPVVNPYFYLNAYNGAGVAIGDINQDGLPDIFFTANLEPNRLFLNKGSLRFDDITERARVAGGDDWCTGATMADVNADGLLDIYVCRAFHSDPAMRANLLYINNGNLTFTERAKEYGIADESFSTQATFFDYDLDGDLDLFVGNHLQRHTLDHAESYRNFTHPTIEFSNHLFRNNGNGAFSDVTLETGILDYGVTLGVVAGDMNQDGWPDVYVANDQQEPDILFFNNHDGTFTNAIHAALRHTSDSSMGIDLADFNNDGYLDLVVSDMLPETNYRVKTQLSLNDRNQFQTQVEHGYHYQYTRNVLQLNNGNGAFSEIAQLAGVAATDWSWAALFADFDNDGLKDLLITNGIKRDIEDKDYKAALDAKLKGGLYEGDFTKLIEMIPQVPMANKYYRNSGHLTFSDESGSSGLDQPGYSNGAAYADLDLDGDLDLVVNNIDAPAGVYRNNASNSATNHFLRVRLAGTSPNTLGLGAKVTVISGGLRQFQELTLTRGFQSSVERTLHFGLGSNTNAESIVVEWPGGTRSILENVPAGQVAEVSQAAATESVPDRWPRRTGLFFTEVTDSAGVDFRHIENSFDDFRKEILLPHQISRLGPKLAVGDVDGNGLQDFYVGGASSQAGRLYLQVAECEFRLADGPWNQDAGFEDTGAVFFDADNDTDLDLYVASGGNEFPDGSALLQDRLYLNQGNAAFIRSMNSLPEMRISGGCVVAADYDSDGDSDLFVGGRVTPGRYPTPPRSFLLQNNNGKFTDTTEKAAPDLLSPGLVASAVWSDFDADHDPDLFLAGEWMPISIFQNDGGKLVNVTQLVGLGDTAGWWNVIVPSDIDEDGDVDFLAGNLGLNTRYRASEAEPLKIYCDDFDSSGSLDIVLAYYESGICYPVRGRERSVAQNPFLASRFPSYKAFAQASVEEIYGRSALSRALQFEAKLLASVVLENRGSAGFAVRPLPIEAQISAIQGAIAGDFNGDGHPDFLVAGNLHTLDVDTGRLDAGAGLLLSGNGAGGFRSIPAHESGFLAPKDARDLKLLSSGPNRPPVVVVANNNDRLQLFRHLVPKD